MAGSYTFRPVLAGSALLLGAVAAAVAPAAPAAAAEVRDPHRFACPPTTANPFVDVAGTTHADAVACAVHHGLTGGTTATTFSPEATVSRGQMASFIVRLLGPEGVAAVDPPPAGFTDTAGGAHEPSIDALVALGIAEGTSPTTFSPAAPVSRAQMATFLHRTVLRLGMRLPAEVPDAFPDDEGDPHEPAIDAIATLGLAGGDADGAYRPRDPVSRGAMAAFLVRVVDLGIENGTLPPRVEVEAFAALGAGEGTAVIATTDVPGVLCFELILADASGDAHAATGAAVHIGTAGDASPPAVALPAPPPGGFVGGCVSDPDAAAVAAEPEAAYVEVLTDGEPLRGQLGRRAVGAIADLDDKQVIPGPGDPGTLGLAVVFTTTQPGVLCGSVAVLSEDEVTGIHLHRGARGANGPVVVDVRPVQAFGVPSWCAPAGDAAAFAADPSVFYVDVHTGAHPGGALRGELQRSG